MNQKEIENMTTPERVLELIKVSSVLAERAKTVEKTASADVLARNQIIPGVVEACVASGDIREQQRGEFSAALGSHTQTLRMLHKMATLRAKSNVKVETIGAATETSRSEKRASQVARDSEPASLTRLRAALKLS